MSKKTEKEKEIESSDDQNSDYDKILFETEEIILLKINERKEENQALKKILENLNTKSPKIKSKQKNS